MDSAEVKKEIARKIEQINDPGILENLDLIVEDLLARSLGKDFWDDLPETLKTGIKKSEKDISEGKGIPHDEVAREIKEKYKH
jgi:hypothetical protein